MTQHLYFVEQMTFETIGFHAALILNRLRTQRLIEEVNREDEERRTQDQRAYEEDTRAKLALVNKKLAALTARVKPPASGGSERGGN